MISADFMDGSFNFVPPVHVFVPFYGREVSLVRRGIASLKERCKFVVLLNCSGSPSMIKWQGMMRVVKL